MNIARIRSSVAGLFFIIGFGVTADARIHWEPRGASKLPDAHGNLIQSDFVVEGTIAPGHRHGRAFVPIEVQEVFLGSIPSRRITVPAALFRMVVPVHGWRGQHVLAWGSWDGTVGDTARVGPQDTLC